MRAMWWFLSLVIFLDRFCYCGAVNEELISPYAVEDSIEKCFEKRLRKYCEGLSIENFPRDDTPRALELQPETTTAITNVTTQSEEVFTYEEDRLIKDLFRNYQKASRARLKDNKPITVSIGFTLIQMNNLDEKRQVLTTSGWMEVAWADDRLSWSPEQYGGVGWIILPASHVWLPDIALSNSAQEIYHPSLVDHKFRITVNHDGTILWIPGGKFHTNCELDITYFPFDDQICRIHFTNWAYTGAEMNLTFSNAEIEMSNYQKNGEWEIVGTKSTREDKLYVCCGNTPFPSVYFHIYMQRKFLYYIINIIAPCIMLSFLVTFVFLLPPDAGEKISLGITVLLSFSVFLLLIADSLPKNSDYVPVISTYLTVFMAMTTMSIFFTVFVLHLHHSGSDNPVPSWLRKFVFDCMARLLCMDSIVNKYGSCQCGRNRLRAEMSEMSETFIKFPLINRPLKKSFTSEGMNDSRSNPAIVEMLDHLQAITKERRDVESAEATREEWQAVAKVVDRFLLCVFLMAIPMSSVIVLGIIPMSKPPLPYPG